MGVKVTGSKYAQQSQDEELRTPWHRLVPVPPSRYHFEPQGWGRPYIPTGPLTDGDNVPFQTVLKVS